MFTVTCSVSKDFEIPADSRMTIYSVDIMGSKGVRIDLGDSDVVAEDGDTLESCFESGLLDSVSEKIIPLMEKVEHTIDSLNVTVSGVNRILTSSNTEHIRRTFMHVESLTANLRKVSDQVNGKSTEIAEIIDNLNVLSAGLKVVMDKVDTTFTEAGEAMASLNAADLTGTVNSIRSLVDNLNDPEGTFGRLMKDDSVYDSVDSLLNNLDRFIDKIQQNPKKYLKISVF